MSRVYFVAVFLCFYLSSCTYKEDCYLATAHLTMSGYDSAALETVVIKDYSPRDHLLDSTAFHLSAKNHSSSGIYVYDTLNKYIVWPFPVSLVPGHSYTIDIPNAARTYNVKNIAQDHGTRKKSFLISGDADADLCYNAITSYTVDDSVHNTGRHYSHNNGGENLTLYR